MNIKPAYWLAGIALLFVNVAQAGITLGGTRLVLQEKNKEASIIVKNDGTEDIMIQSWVESNGPQKADDVPFALTPALSRLGAGKQQSLRIFYFGKGLAADKESVFWLSVQEIPQKAKVDNTLQIAVRQRIKLFYRPTELVGTAQEAIKTLRWKLVSDHGKQHLQVTNPSMYHVSFGTAHLAVGGKRYPVSTEMMSPGTTVEFPITNAPAITDTGATLVFITINDYGAPIENIVSLSR